MGKYDDGLPETPPEDDSKKLSILYTFICNHLNHRVRGIDIQQKFIITLLVILIAIYGFTFWSMFEIIKMMKGLM